MDFIIKFKMDIVSAENTIYIFVSVDKFISLMLLFVYQVHHSENTLTWYPFYLIFLETNFSARNKSSIHLIKVKFNWLIWHKSFIISNTQTLKSGQNLINHWTSHVYKCLKDSQCPSVNTIKSIRKLNNSIYTSLRRKSGDLFD